MVNFMFSIQMWCQIPQFLYKLTGGCERFVLYCIALRYFYFFCDDVNTRWKWLSFFAVHLVGQEENCALHNTPPSEASECCLSHRFLCCESRLWVAIGSFWTHEFFQEWLFVVVVVGRGGHIAVEWGRVLSGIPTLLLTGMRMKYLMMFGFVCWFSSKQVEQLISFFATLVY